MQDERRVDMSETEFRALFQAVCNWRRWGEEDDRCSGSWQLKRIGAL